MGCVTDMQWKKALMDLYPNRNMNHLDQFKRKKMAQEKRDLPELASKSMSIEARRYYAS